MPSILSTLLILFFSSVAFGQTVTPTPSPGAVNDDLFLQTRLESKTVNWLIERTRMIMKSAKMGDPLVGESVIAEMPTFVVGDISSDPQFVQFQQIFSKTFNVDIKNAVIRLRIPKVGYNITTVQATPTRISVQDPILDLTATASINGITVTLPQGLQADFMIPNAKTKVLETYLTGTLDPIQLVIPSVANPLQFNVHFQTMRDQDFKFALQDYNMDGVPAFVKANEPAFVITAGANNTPLSPNNIRVDPVTVRINPKMSTTIQFDSFKGLLQRKLPDLERLIFDQLALSLKNDLGKELLDSIFESGVHSDLIIDNPHIYTRFATTSFSAPAANQLQLNVRGDLCTAVTYTQYKQDCTKYEPVYEAPRVISDDDNKAAHDEITSSLTNNDSDVVMSVSEGYLNRLLRTTIDATLWNAELSDMNVTLGDKGVFVIFDERTQTPQVFLDLLYFGDGTGLEGMIVNPKHPLHFPLRLSANLKFELRGDVPWLVIKADTLLSDANEIMNGIPQYDMPSKLIPLLRRKVANMIVNMATKMEGKTVVEMDIPDLTGVGLENTTYEVSPFGRLNLFFKL